MTKECGQLDEQFFEDNREEWPITCAYVDFMKKLSASFHTTEALSVEWNKMMKKASDKSNSEVAKAEYYQIGKKQFHLLRQQCNDRIIFLNMLLSKEHIEEMKEIRKIEMDYFNEINDLLEDKDKRRYWHEGKE